MCDLSVSVATYDTGVDSDGDGVDDGIDNCPNDHNPDQRDICSSTTVKPSGGCRASLFVARPAELNRPLLVVEFADVEAVEADRPTCDEGTPLLILPPGWREVSSSGRLVYVLSCKSRRSWSPVVA